MGMPAAPHRGIVDEVGRMSRMDTGFLGSHSLSKSASGAAIGGTAVWTTGTSAAAARRRVISSSRNRSRSRSAASLALSSSTRFLLMELLRAWEMRAFSARSASCLKAVFTLEISTRLSSRFLYSRPLIWQRVAVAPRTSFQTSLLRRRLRSFPVAPDCDPWFCLEGFRGAFRATAVQGFSSGIARAMTGGCAGVCREDGVYSMSGIS